MDDLDVFEPGTHNFTGTVKSWSANSGELVTDSGLSIIFATQGQQPVPVGARITIVAKRYRPRYLAVGMSRA